MRRLSAIVLVLALLPGEPGPPRSGAAPSIDVRGWLGGSGTACTGSGPPCLLNTPMACPARRGSRGTPRSQNSALTCSVGLGQWPAGGCRVAGQQGWHAPPPRLPLTFAPLWSCGGCSPRPRLCASSCARCASPRLHRYCPPQALRWPRRVTASATAASWAPAATALAPVLAPVPATAMTATPGEKG